MNNITTDSNNLSEHIKTLEKYLSLMGIDSISVNLEIKNFNTDKDTVEINFENSEGFIAGSSPIALLNGIYRFLEECGCRFLRPGKLGEIIPKNIKIPKINIKEEADFRHRGICIEGAVSKENVLDVIDWEAKNSMNTYFTQFRQSHTFFDRWYSHIYNPTETPNPITVEEADCILKDIVKDVKSKGMVYQAVGHGWTCEPFGYNALGWDKVNYEIKAEDRQYFAEIKGKRDFWNKLPINTNLCYSNPKTREIIVKDIVKYLKGNPAVDILHLWLADDFNNHCECENCQKMRPSDFYVQMLNELDEALTEAGLDTKIVFLVYFDLLWKPLCSKIKNQDRFIIMFAPITRTYLESFETVKNPKEPCDYIRNNITVPKTDEEFVGLFNDWRKDFGGDSFNFDYYLMWQYVKDPSFIRTAKLISRDIKCYDRLTLDGLISCQVQRVFMPTSLPMYVMAKTLWNQNLSYEEIEEDYYKNAFGKNYTKALDYSHRLSELFDNNFIIPEIKKTQEAEKTFAECVSYLKNILPELENIKEENPVCQYSWKLLTDYGYLTIDFAETILAAINDSRDKFTECYNKLTEKVYKYDNLYKECFDGWGFMNVLQGMFADFLPKNSE